ncbi:NADPH-dependent F420 reductase [Dactylosporangium sp. CA-233914]|uniref:NADPH-dependent F420 reductase n=1 Tax=Dactylosporangium sp. CA-233914 TaxID=3239934 RepID=UPI003D8ADF87
MKIGIIGSGHIGGTLTRRLRELGHDVTVANSRGPGSLAGLAAETGANPGTVAEAARGEVVVLAVPLRAVPDLPAADLAGRVVIDADNYYPARDGAIADIDGGVTSSRWTASKLPGVQLVKVFNTIQSDHLLRFGRPTGGDGRVALPVAADDPTAKRLVMGLIDELGFDPIDAGGLDDSWRQEPGTPVYGADLDAAGVRAGLAAATR